jgi:hypothetical protein
MFSLRTHALITGGLLGLIILMAIVGNAVQASGLVKNPASLQTPMRIVFFTAFALFAFSCVPTMVKLFAAGQDAIGNAEKAPIRFITAHQVGVIWIIWIIWIASIVVAFPTMLRNGFFNDAGGSSPAAGSDDAEIAREIARTPVQGSLVAAPGMNVMEMLHGSSLKIERTSNAMVPDQPVYAGGAIFNYRVAGTDIEFPRCRYYYISTYTYDRSRIEAINIGTASAKMTRSELNEANAKLRARLKLDGWLTGHEAYRDEEDQTLHGGKTRGGEGKLWLKGDTTLDIEERRIDDEKPGEDPATAGEWIQFIDLRRRADYPWIERYEFAPPAD